MCDICSELLFMLESYEERCQVGGFQMSKKDIMSFVNFVCVWPQRQCMCCFKNSKNFEKLNNMVQLILSVAIRVIQTLPEDFQQEQQRQKDKEAAQTEEKSLDSKEKEEKDSEKKEGKQEKEEKSMDTDEDDESEDPEKWSMEEKEKLLHSVTKIFLMNFPSYIAYKHVVHPSREDPEVPLFLLQNVCYFCDSNGIGALRQCFEKGTPDTLPFTFAHILITLIANLRLWMNIPTVMQYIIPLRTAVIRYMCKLSDKDLRMAGNRNMTDLMWAAVKEPLEAHFTFDKEGLDLAFKYFTCSTLTIRLAGIAQINNQINLYNESCNNETLLDADRVGHHLSQWLLDNKIIEHIFGPNLHVELIKQSQLILNLLAMEGKITSEHIDCVWASSQLKHCSKQVYDILIPLIKNLDVHPVQHLLRLVSALEPTSHTESTLYLASALIKCIWNTCVASQTSVSQHHAHAQAQYTALQQDEDMHEGEGKAGKHEMSSSESIQMSEDGESEKCCNKPKLQSQKRGSPAKKTPRSKDQIQKVKDSQHEKHMDDVDSEGLHGHSGDSELDHSGESDDHRHVHRHPIRHPRRDSEASDSEIDGSESSEDEELEEGEVADSRHRQQLLQAHRRAVAKYHCNHHHAHHHDTSEEEEEEEEEDDSEYLEDSEDEELLKEAKLVHMKHTCQDSEGSSDFEDEARMVHEGKMSYQMAQRILRKHHQQQQRILHQAHQLALQSQQKVRRRGERPKDQGQRKVKSGEDQPEASEEDKGEDKDASQELVKQEDLANTSLESIESDVAMHGGSQDSGLEQAEGGHSPGGLTPGQETEIFDCSSFIQQVGVQRQRQRHIQGREYIENIMSPDDGEGSCHSSHISTKSEKNMADFEGEDFISDEELAQIDASRSFNPHQMQQHLSSLASMYHTHMPHVIHHRPQQKEMFPCHPSDFPFDDVCGKGNTLLWDLVQEETAHMLPEGLAMEAEKALCTLVCYSTDRKIKMKFIEASIENLSQNKSVVVSLRLLQKIFSSFQPYRSGADTHHVTMWAEKELHMMSHFFINLVYYTEAIQAGNTAITAMYCHKEQVQVRLDFLTCVFSAMGSPDGFRLNLEQVDTLWRCIALDIECSDECLKWFLNQAKSKDHHAMGLETFKHIFLEKMPQLKPESMSMIGLNLFQQLSHLTRIANASLDKSLTEDQVCGMDQLWNMALKATNTDVSITAIQILNSYYINYGNSQLEKEEEFVQRCMDSLVQALSDLNQNPDTNLLVIQRGLVLLKNHLEAFRKRYAYHLRNWQIDGKGIRSHQRSIHDKQSSMMRVILQPAGMTDKTQLEMSSTDLVAELRAEVTRWWEGLHKQQLARHQAEGAHSSTMLSPILGAMLGDGPIRMITLGQDLTVDMDEKSLGDMQFKDMQLVFVSVGASRPQRKMDGSIPSSCLPAPSHSKLPVMLMIQEPHFSKLFTLLERLGKLDFTSTEMESQERWGLQTKARVLSRKVWELLMLLPTNQSMLEGFNSIVSEESTEKADHWDTLLAPNAPHKLMYSLQIVEALSRTPRHRRKFSMRTGAGDSRAMSVDSEMDTDSSEEIWSQKFITKGGLKHLLSIFKSGVLQAKEDEAWSQWNQECLAYLLRLISQFSVELSDAEAGHDDVFESYESPRKKMKRHKGSSEKIIIPRLNQSTLSMLNIESILKILMQILYDAAFPSDTNPVNTGTWGRAEVVHYSWLFLVSWAYSSEEVKHALCSAQNFVSWLRRLTLDAPEPFVRREACMGLYRLCLGRTADSKTGYTLLMPMLTSLLSFLNEALTIKPQRNFDLDGLKEKEPQGPGCRDYFWLVCRFVDSISKEDAKSDKDEIVNINNLAKDVSNHIIERQYLETRQGFEEDDGVIGLLNLMTAIIKHNPTYKPSPEGQSFLEEVFWLLFALPSPSKRYLPKCKSQTSRSSAYDLLVEFVKGSVDNFGILHKLMMKQHTKDAHTPYPWDYWPHEDGRSKCGYVGLTNLGATCYMATCMQHLYMLPQARQSVLQANCSKHNKYEGTMSELKKMFAYLQESERKAYNPRSFCKTYTMDKQPLNTGEQKDMTEFFTDLISKLEDMSPEMHKLVKSLFGGILTNNVVSLDCPHVSRTLEEFYTVRCQVTDMKNLYESLDEVTVKDMLEGDNMYTCSKCQKKVRAEKRACFKRLPRILCFNTMRYTFNMVTMMKEKVNTHFSFPLCLDMSQYMEKTLMGPDKLKVDDDEDERLQMLEMEDDEDEGYDYELTGVTVHTGTADGGHYYSFIRDRMHTTDNGQDKWYLFNDAEVKPFDPSQIATECFGGEMTSKTYDSVTDKFMDFSFEKTNSAYMLFYERCPAKKDTEEPNKLLEVEPVQKFNFELSKELAEWIWQDNMHFLQDKNIFEHTYFGFIWQICGYIPTTLSKDPQLQVSLRASQLSTSFVLETLIHAKEKPTMLQWIELLTKQFNTCPSACEWFLDHMAESDWWPIQILIKCPNQMVRQMFQRLLIHVISQLRSAHMDLYLQPFIEGDDGEIDVSELGTKSCVTRFIKKMLTIIEHGVRPHSKYLTEYFAFLLEFAKMGDEECFFLINSNAISTMIGFYMGQKAQENYVEIPSDDEEDEVITITDDNYKPMSLEKMITLIALLVEKSRSEDNQLHISDKDYNSVIGGKGFPFMSNQIRDNINVRQTCNLIFSLCRWNEQLAVAIVTMVFSAIKKLSIEHSQPFFKLMSMLVEFGGGPPGLPPFTQYVLQRFWELTKSCPQPCLEWMSTQVTRNKLASHWLLNQMESWVEPYLIANNNVRVRNATACLLVSLVPSNHFRQTFVATRRILSPQKEISISTEGIVVLHQIFNHLLNLLQRAKVYADSQSHGTTKLLSYFTVLTYCLITREEKLMFSSYFGDLWQLFQPRLCEPQISMHHNKQALLYFWYQVCQDCPENIKLIVTNPHVCKQIAYNYILADHEDQEVVMFNRIMLPSYYGLLRMCCQQSRSFTRTLAQHQNIQWAFKNISPYPAQYTQAVEELFKIMKMMATKYQDSTEEEIRSVNLFKRNMMQMFLNFLDARSMWQTLISALKVLIDTTDDRLLLIYQQGLQMITEAFNTLHVMYHEATACHVTGDIVDLLSILLPVLKVARHFHEKKGSTAADVNTVLQSWKDRMEFVKKLLTLLNSYTPPEIRHISIEVLREMILTFQSECVHTVVPILTQAHVAFQESNLPMTMGPYFPRRGQKPIGPKSNIRPPRPQFNMMLHSSQIEATKGVDDMYDNALLDFFSPYHALVDLLCRVAVNHQSLNEAIINLSAMVAIEGVPLHSPYFAKLWYEIYHSEVDRNCINILCNSNIFIEYVDSVLLDERLSLSNHNIYQFLCNFFPKVFQQVLNDQGRSLLDSLVASVTAEKAAAENIRSERDFLNICYRINGDLRTMLLIFSVQPPKQLNSLLVDSLQYILQVCRQHQHQRAADTSQRSVTRKRSGSQGDSGEEEEATEEISGETSAKKQKLSCETSEELVKNSTESEKSTSFTSNEDQSSGKVDNESTHENAISEGANQSKSDSSQSESAEKSESAEMSESESAEKSESESAEKEKSESAEKEKSESAEKKSESAEQEKSEPCADSTNKEDSDQDSDVVIVIPSEEDKPIVDNKSDVESKSDTDNKSSIESKLDVESKSDTDDKSSIESKLETEDVMVKEQKTEEIEIQSKDQDEAMKDCEEPEPGPSGHCRNDSQEPSSGESRQSSSDEMPRSRERPTIVDYVAKHIEHIICSYGKVVK
ncbi:ubiquitin carboxyl-terminal hydrolase 34-like isoform X3 [Mizuhopecten yessoensis]|uniref:ubiquitin carboxyl-terminal hydrolase 34-like isoform X3 n=1 Tax=Mizuhopecten yessoensis TaxID=6573 RepID=UPI000B45809C|nr:ubiquitin carboxyl-terminal hydrolase 34-like isoform X3 [Mizuhopecten yessoensis]